MNLAAFADPFIDFTRQALKQKGRDLHVLDLTSDIGIPVFLAVSANSEGRLIALRLGAHLSAGIALSRAVAELNQSLSVDDALDNLANAADDDEVARWYREGSLDRDNYLRPSDAEPRRPSDFRSFSANSLDQAVMAAVEAVRDVGVDVLAMDLSRPEIDFACACVVAPGLRHFWARYAPGRLYDVPVKMGWLSATLREEELNPIPFFL